MENFVPGYSKGAFKLALQIRKLVEDGGLFNECRSKKQYEARLRFILKTLTEDSHVREQFMTREDPYIIVGKNNVPIKFGVGRKR